MVLRCLFLQKFVSLQIIGAETTICTILTVKVCAQTVITKTKKDEKMKYLERAIDGELKKWGPRGIVRGGRMPLPNQRT